ncbi:MAG: hypothetical protein ACLQIB_20885 [Isosphaeraceae bacterium]
MIISARRSGFQLPLAPDDPAWWTTHVDYLHDAHRRPPRAAPGAIVGEVTYTTDRTEEPSAGEP